MRRSIRLSKTMRDWLDWVWLNTTTQETMAA